MMEKSRILVATPTFDGHKEWAIPYLEQHKDYDVVLVDNTYGNTEYYEYLLSLKGDYPNLKKVIRHEWNPKNTWILYMLGDCRQKCIDEVKKGGYTHWLWNDMDIFLQGQASTEKLLAEDLDYIGYPCNMFSQSGPPSVYKSEWKIFNEESGRLELDKYTWKEIRENKKVTPVYGCIGYSLIKREVLDLRDEWFKCPQDGDLGFGEDLLFLDEINREGIQIHCDFKYSCMNFTKVNKDVMLHRKAYIVCNETTRLAL